MEHTRHDSKCKCVRCRQVNGNRNTCANRLMRRVRATRTDPNDPNKWALNTSVKVLLKRTGDAHALCRDDVKCAGVEHLLKSATQIVKFNEEHIESNAQIICTGRKMKLTIETRCIGGLVLWIFLRLTFAHVNTRCASKITFQPDVHFRNLLQLATQRLQGMDDYRILSDGTPCVIVPSRHYAPVIVNVITSVLRVPGVVNLCLTYLTTVSSWESNGSPTHQIETTWMEI